MRRSKCILAIAILVGACEQVEIDPGMDPKVIAPQQALALASSGEAVLVDVRLPQERKGTDIPPHMAAWFPFDRYAPEIFNAEVSALVGGQRSRQLILICEVGVRSGWAAKSLGDAGFTNVWSVSQGYALWRANKLRLVSGPAEPTPNQSLE